MFYFCRVAIYTLYMAICGLEKPAFCVFQGIRILFPVLDTSVSKYTLNSTLRNAENMSV